MGVGCQSRRFNCLFWRETRQRILGHEISPYPEVVRGGEWELTTRPRRERVGGRRPREAVGSWTGENESWWLESREASSRRQSRLDKREANSRSWRGRAEGQSTPDTEQRGSWWQESRRESWWLESRERVGSWTGDHGSVGGWRAERQAAEGSCGWTGERRTERLAWIHGGAVNTRETRQHGIGSSEKSLKMSDSSGTVEFSLVTHASDSPHMHVVLQYLPLLLVTPSLLFVRLFCFLLSPSIVFLCGGKKCALPPQPLVDHRPAKKWNG